jgi:hypothetical protein
MIKIIIIMAIVFKRSTDRGTKFNGRGRGKEEEP